MARSGETQYLNTLRDVMQDGEKVPNRTGVDTYRLLGVTHRYNFKDGFPLFTTKKVYWKGVVHELLWFLRGDTNIKYLVDNNVNIWNDDAYRWYTKKVSEFGMSPLPKEEFIQLMKEPQASDAFISGYRLGDLGPVYGAQWRHWRDSIGYPIDQVQKLINDLKNNPSSRRHIISAWNAAEIEDMALPPCHVLSQFTVRSDGTLWCHMYQRSCDMLLGVPFNVASYSLLTYIIAHLAGLKPGGFIHTMHDCHIYENHLDACREQITRDTRSFPTLTIASSLQTLDQLSLESFSLDGYDPHPAIKAELVT